MKVDRNVLILAFRPDSLRKIKTCKFDGLNVLWHKIIKMKGI